MLKSILRFTAVATAMGQLGELPQLSSTCVSACPSMEATWSELTTAISGVSGDQILVEGLGVYCNHRSAMDCLSSNAEQCQEVTSVVGNLNISASMECYCELCPSWMAAYPVLLRSFGWLALGMAGQVNEATLAQQTCGHYEALHCVTNSTTCRDMLRTGGILRLTWQMRFMNCLCSLMGDQLLLK
eukprot:s118_g17.t1